MHCVYLMLDASWLDLFYHELQCLVTTSTLEVLCIYVLRSQKGLARYHYCYIISWLFWQSVVNWDILLLLASWLCHWYEWIWFLRVIICMVSYDLCWKPRYYLSLYTDTRTKEFVKVFLYHFQFVNWIASLRTSNELSLGELIHLCCIYFSNHICSCFLL